jgi:hypothetical protein
VTRRCLKAPAIDQLTEVTTEDEEDTTLVLGAYLLAGLDDSNAAIISEPTQEFGSPATRLKSNATAAEEATSPSAQAACPRTRGSGSQRASASTATASHDGASWSANQFPMATHTFCANPARPTLRIAEPRENASQPSSESAAMGGSPGLPDMPCAEFRRAAGRQGSGAPRFMPIPALHPCGLQNPSMAVWELQRLGSSSRSGIQQGTPGG